MANAYQAALNRLADNIASVLLGKREAIRLAIVTLLAEGHLLIEDVPGVGKTLLAKALAKSLNCTFHRVQFTPDLLPSDLIGTSVYHQPSGEFIFKPGPLFANVVLADEINRATPRTQSALLEAMSDRQVSVDGVTHHLEAPFIVMATQNPYEFEGTYALPENQLDRFAVRLKLGYPDRKHEKEVLTQHREGEPVDHLRPVVSKEEVIQMQAAVRHVRVDDSLNEYLMDIVDATRSRDELYLGVSTRGALTLYRCSQALALFQGRDYVIPDDIKTLAVPVLSHRVVSRGFRQNGRADSASVIIERILAETRVPV
ncbi:MAG: MoxR family ATPase [Gemmatales bacterium]|nr:MoxR family ATPase [Gemmatales bacterium]MDW8386684.1 MoxR family ATPase [Gemmatales bacterium]